jgi:Ras-related protein Rab-5C
VLLIGEPSADKFSFGENYLAGGFSSDLKLTLGLNFFTKLIESNGLIFKLQIWDIEEQGRFKSIYPQYCRGAKAAFILYDITESFLFENLPYWIQTIRLNAGNIPILLIGYDLESEELREISIEDAISLTERYNIERFMEISIRTGQNINELFNLLAQILAERDHSREFRSIPRKIIPEFRVSDYLTLKLQNYRVNIYVKDKLFSHCKYLLLNIPNQEIENYDEIGSIDEAAEKLDRSMEHNGRININIPIETEFWGHCSNIQTWYENGYDTRLLHRNLAFPLLKALVEAGDHLARKVFKEEIAMRLESGHPSVVQYLINQGYLEYLSDEELKLILENSKFLQDLSRCTNYLRDIPNWLSKMIYDHIKSPILGLPT